MVDFVERPDRITREYFEDLLAPSLDHELPESLRDALVDTWLAQGVLRERDGSYSLDNGNDLAAYPPDARLNVLGTLRWYFRADPLRLLVGVLRQAPGPLGIIHLSPSVTLRRHIEDALLALERCRWNRAKHVAELRDLGVQRAEELLDFVVEKAERWLAAQSFDDFALQRRFAALREASELARAGHRGTVAAPPITTSAPAASTRSTDDPNVLVTVSEASTRLRRPSRTIRNWIRRKLDPLPPVDRLGGPRSAAARYRLADIAARQPKSRR